jgi:hypothetical protein
MDILTLAFLSTLLLALYITPAATAESTGEDAEVPVERRLP